MLNNFSNEDWRTFEEQMPVVERVLGEESYGEKALGSVKWFNSIMRKVKEYSTGTSYSVSYLTVEQQMEVVGEAILSWLKTPDEITEEERAELPEYLGALYDEPLLTVYHQFNKNVLDLMSSAYNESALRSMVVSRFSPSNYQRKTAAPSESKLEMSAQILGDYSFTISTTEDIEKYPECVKVGGVVEGGGGAMSLMKSMKAEKSSKYAFGSKTDPAPKTLTALCEEIKSGGITSLEISTDNMTGDAHTACYVAETTLSRSHSIAPYGWLFLNGQAARFSGVEKVTHIMAIRYGGKENYIFILTGSKGCRRVTSNIGWSEYLSSSVRQIAGSTFEAVARRMPVKYPSMTRGTELAIGIGTSRKDVHGELTKKIYVRINKTRWISINKA
jgi:microcystin-dependent protein